MLLIKCVDLQCQRTTVLYYFALKIAVCLHAMYARGSVYIFGLAAVFNQNVANHKTGILSRLAVLRTVESPKEANLVSARCHFAAVAAGKLLVGCCPH